VTSNDYVGRRRLRLGVFMPPWSIPVNRNPTLFIRECLDLVSFLDELGYDEAWIGEHHSSGYQVIGSPELFVSAAIERTQRIRIGTGVISLPYHNPLMVADRIVQLDHQARGRAMFGFGQGLTPTDAAMLAINPDDKRRRMEDALEVVLRLLDGEVVTCQNDWIDLREATLQLAPYSIPRPDMVVASSVSTTGGANAGRHGLGMLCVAAGSTAGFDVLDQNWKIANIAAAEHGHSMDRTALRLVGPIHIAPTREQAIAEVSAGFEEWREFIERTWTGGASAIGMGSVEAIIESGVGVIGTPDDALAYIERLWAKTGGFGCMLTQITNWARDEATRTSLKLIADRVLPEFTGREQRRIAAVS
jgi:limonene 1,2-monooxygenase